jgi:hypothetical protein
MQSVVDAHVQTYLPTPSTCAAQLVQLMRDCWTPVAQRPTFATILKYVQDIRL